MGAENSVLEGCEWGEAVQAPSTLPWKLTPVTKPDGSVVSVFEPKNTEKKDKDMLRKSALTLKSIRHPNVVRFVGCGETSDNFWLATESVLPLTTAVPDMTPAELCAGIFDLLQGLDFLHTKLGISHNNLSLSSVYVAPDGVWKLGGFEHSCTFLQATQDYLDKCRAFRVEESLAPEEKSNGVKANSATGHTRDVFAFGVLVDSLMDLVQDKDDICEILEHQLSECVHVDPSSRPQVSTILNMSVFRNDLIDIIAFLKSITLKTEIEKRLFFSNLLSRLHCYSEIVIARRLMRLLLSRFVLLDEWAVKMVLPSVLQPQKDTNSSNLKSYVSNGLLSESMFQRHVICHIYNVFHVHDSHIRLVLLEHFTHYVHLFSRQQLEDDIFIQVLLGLRDTDDKIVAASLKALADLVPILGGDYVIGGKRKPFFFHGLPKQISPEDLKQMDVPRNLNTAMSQHKPLLKDLATATGMFGSLHVDVQNEKQQAERDRKNKEREQRREEARKKREERKKRLKEKQLEDDIQQTTLEDEMTQNNLTIEQVADMDLDKSQEDAVKLGKSHPHPQPLKVIDSNEDDEVDDDDEAWSDMEGPCDKDLDDEIESELSNMPTTLDSKTKIQTSPDPYRNRSAPSPPLVKLDFSDIPKTDGLKTVHSLSSRGPLQLGTSSDSQIKDNKFSSNGVGPVREEDDWGDDEAWGDDSINKSSEEPVQTNSLSSKQNNSLKLVSNKAKTKTSAVKKSTSGGDLGFGYDIKSIEIVAKSAAETDFFADMTPALPPASKMTLELESAINGAATQGESGSKTKMFAMAENVEEEVSGWGEEDDLDWGDSF